MASLETYVVLDNESERTILLHEAAQTLGLQRETEYRYWTMGLFILCIRKFTPYVDALYPSV